VRPAAGPRCWGSLNGRAQRRKQAAAGRRRAAHPTPAHLGSTLPNHAPGHPAPALFREVRDTLARSGGESLLAKALPGALRSLQDCTWRVCDGGQLMKLKGFGHKTAGVGGARRLAAVRLSSVSERASNGSAQFGHGAGRCVLPWRPRAACRAEAGRKFGPPSAAPALRPRAAPAPTPQIVADHLWKDAPPEEEDEEERAQRLAWEAEAKAAAKGPKAPSRGAPPAAPPASAAGTSGGSGCGYSGAAGASGSGSGGGSGGGLGAPAAPRVAAHDPLEALRSVLGGAGGGQCRGGWERRGKRLALDGAPAGQRPLC
jgi:hypothetical protein